MTLPSHLSPTILNASINPIVPLFLIDAQGDEQAARQAVTDLLTDYHPQTNEELTLATEIIHFRLLARDNLRRSHDPELPLTKVLRLRGSAVSLSREANNAQRKLDKLQALRATAAPEAAPEPETNPPTPAERVALQVARDIINGKKPSKYGGQSYAQQLSKQAMLLTMKENAARNAAAQPA